MSVFRALLMKLIYKNIYKIIDKSMGDRQIGSRKNVSIRNHIWVVNSAICDVNSSKTKKPIDIKIYYYKQGFSNVHRKNSLFENVSGLFF